MKNSMVLIFWILTACTSSIEPVQNPVGEKRDTSIIKTNILNGLWLESKGKYESSFVFICNDTVYIIKGPAEKYYIRHDTLHLTSGGRFKRKIIELDSSHLKWKTLSGEIFTLYKKSK